MNQTLNDKLSEKEKLNFSTKSINPNGLIFISIDQSILIATFGRSALSSLVKSNLESDFGIKTAMNMCGNEEIKQTKSFNNSIAPTNINRHVSTPSDPFVFGLDDAEDLNYISAHIKGNRLATLQGKDNLTLKINGKEKINWEKLINQCRLFLNEYEKNSYVNLFPNYKNFKPATEIEENSLNKLLVEAIKSKNNEDIKINIPDFISNDEFSFAYTTNSKNEDKVYSGLYLSQLEAHLNFEKLTIQNLKNRRIYAYSHEEQRVLKYKSWPIFDCLIFEIEFSEKHFILRNGKWVLVDPDFYSKIKNIIKETVHVETCEELYKNIDIADRDACQNKEALFNEEACARNQNSIMFDRAKLQIGNGRKDKEFCDILDFSDDEKVRIIHCKPFKGSSALNYLFSQAKIYGEAFLHDDVFLKQIRQFIEQSECHVKDKYLKYIPENIEDINGRDFNICLWLLYDANKPLPTKEDIPLTAQYELKLTYEYLRRVCKFNKIVLRFIPVKTIVFTKGVKPKK